MANIGGWYSIYPRGRGAVAQKMEVIIPKIPDGLLRQGFIMQVVRRLQISSSILEAEARKAMT